VGIWWYSARRQSSEQISSFPPKANPEAKAQSQLPLPAVLSLEELARVEPPVYSPLLLRGPEDEGQEAFRQAMQYYVKGDYAKAIHGLRAAAKASPEAARFNFYLGICYLLTGQTDLAIKFLRGATSPGDSAYSEPAHFYLAKAYLKKKDVSRAEDELQAAIQLHGNNEVAAGEILRQLRK
jgi:TolA-binding protein